MQYLLLIHGNAQGGIDPAEWNSFFDAAQTSELFKGGSELGARTVLGNLHDAKPTDHIAGFMRFESDDPQALLDLLQAHPVVLHGGTIELCEMPESQDTTPGAPT